MLNDRTNDTSEDNEVAPYKYTYQAWEMISKIQYKMYDCAATRIATPDSLALPDNQAKDLDDVICPPTYSECVCQFCGVIACTCPVVAVTAVATPTLTILGLFADGLACATRKIKNCKTEDNNRLDAAPPTQSMS